MTKEARMEALSTALDAFNRAAPVDQARMESRLLDACLDLGMSLHEPSVQEWASQRIATWLLSAPFRSIAQSFGAR